MAGLNGLFETEAKAAQCKQSSLQGLLLKSHFFKRFLRGILWNVMEA